MILLYSWFEHIPVEKKEISCMYTGQTGKTTTIRRTAVLETCVSRHHFIGPALCRETPVFRSPDVNFSRLAGELFTEKSFQNLIKSKWNQIVFTIFLLIWIDMNVRLDPNQSENGKYNLILFWFNKISKRFLCVYCLCHYTWQFFWCMTTF